MTDAAAGTVDETPVFRHHKESPTWRGGAGRADPGINRMTNSGVVDESVWNPSEFWSSSLVTASFPSSWEAADIAATAADYLGLPEPPPYRVDAVPFGVDWVKTVQESWDPIRVGDVLIAFPWHDATAVDIFYAKASQGIGRAAHRVTLEGGAAFGTGEHPTTVMCFEWMQERCNNHGSRSGSLQVSGRRVLDYGAGSGILGLGALALGAVAAVGVEVDRDAIGKPQRPETLTS